MAGKHIIQMATIAKLDVSLTTPDHERQLNIEIFHYFYSSIKKDLNTKLQYLQI